MSSKSYDNISSDGVSGDDEVGNDEIADDLISQSAERVRREALRMLTEFDIEDDDARMEPLPGSVLRKT